MAVNTTIKNRTKLGNAMMNVVEVVITAEVYEAGGIEILPVKIGLEQIYVVFPAPAGGYYMEYNHATNKLMLYHPTAVFATAEAGDAGVDNTVIRADGNNLGVSGAGATVVVRNLANELLHGSSVGSATVRLIAIGT